MAGLRPHSPTDINRATRFPIVQRGLATIDERDTRDGAMPDRLLGFFGGWPNRPVSDTHLLPIHRAAADLAIERDSRRAGGCIARITDRISAAYIPHPGVQPISERHGFDEREAGVS